MKDFRIKLADKVISARVQFDSTEQFCKDYLTDCTDALLSVEVTSDDIENERIKSRQERELEGLAPYEFPDAYLETLALYRRIAERLLDYGIILFHGSAIEMDGKAYIFTAKSGTGKSTHTRLWRKVFGERVRMINDDKPLIGIENGKITVYGTPWQGKHNLGANCSAPLAAVSVLERSDNNFIERMSHSDAFMKLLTQIYRINDGEKMKKILSLCDTLTSSVGVFRLGCNMNDDAAIVAYQGMRGNKDEA